jgi:hypothetical protein
MAAKRIAPRTKEKEIAALSVQKLRTATIKERLDTCWRRIQRGKKWISENRIIPEPRKPGQKTNVLQPVMELARKTTRENPDLSCRKLARMIATAMRRIFPGMLEPQTAISVQTMTAIRKMLPYRFQHARSVWAPNPKQIDKRISFTQAAANGEFD